MPPIVAGTWIRGSVFALRTWISAGCWREMGVSYQQDAYGTISTIDSPETSMS